MRVGVCAPHGKQIDGFTYDDCRIQWDAPAVRKPVRWKDQRTLLALKDRSVLLQFELQGAILYSYRFADE